MSDKSTEALLNEKELNAPRLNPDLIEDLIAGEQYTYPTGTNMTICILTLKNGFNVTGESAAASPENFDADIGMKIARQNATAKIWSVAGYELKQRLHNTIPADRLPNTVISAIVAHEVNRIWCQMNNDFTQPSWVDAPDWQRQSAHNGIHFHMSHPEAGNSASHDSWMAEKLADGWVYGEVKDPEAKTHPCIRPFEELPRTDQIKDGLFRGIAHAVMNALDT